MQSIIAHRVSPSCCFASCSNMLLAVLQRNTDLKLSRLVEKCFSTCLVQYCGTNCWDTIRTQNGMSLNSSTDEHVFLFLAAMVYKVESRSTFCKWHYSETSERQMYFKGLLITRVITYMTNYSILIG